MGAAETLGVLSLVINLVVLVVNARTRADIAEMKLEIYKEFVRRDEMPHVYPLRKRESAR